MITRIDSAPAATLDKACTEFTRATGLDFRRDIRSEDNDRQGWLGPARAHASDA